MRVRQPGLKGTEKFKDLAHRGVFPDVFNEGMALVGSGSRPNLELYETIVYASNFPGCLMLGPGIGLVAEMERRGITPSPVIYNYLLKLLATSPDYLKSSEVHTEMKKNRFQVSDDGWQLIVAGHLFDGHFEIALDIIEERRRRVVHRSTYEHTTYRLCRSGEGEEALRIAEMLEDGGFCKTPARVKYQLLVVGTKQMHVSIVQLP